MSSRVSPEHPEVGVIALLPDTIDGVWMGRHQLLSRLTRHFRVIWVNPAPPWRDVWAGRDAWAKDARTGFSSHPSGLEILNPGRWLPKFWRPAMAARLSERICLLAARWRLERAGCREIILYLCRPDQASALDSASYDASCYHIFDEYSFAEHESGLDPIEAKIIRRVSQVFAASQTLLAKKGHINGNTCLLPNGVDFRRFSACADEPEDLRRIGRPRMGYCGIIKKQLDLELLANLANRLPNHQFVLVGPIGNVAGQETALERLRNMQNTHFLGFRHRDTMPAYIQHFDLCLLPYAINEYTKYISPLKLNEYLATGRPIVSANFEPFRAYSGLIRLARTEDEWEEALRSWSDERQASDNLSAQRRARARQRDWNTLVDQMASVLLSRLTERRAPMTVAEERFPKDIPRIDRSAGLARVIHRNASSD